jgi:hypothetical protein
MLIFRANPPGEDGRRRKQAYLVYDNWDDYGFKTSFGAFLFDAHGRRHELGGVKILQKGMTGDKVPVPTQFEALDQTWMLLRFE